MALEMPSEVYRKRGDVVLFDQLAVKVAMDSVSNESYFDWLDRTRDEIHRIVPGSKIVEKAEARTSPPLNTAVYYDTVDYRILPSGALLRTSCNRITHAFCAFKDAANGGGVRRDHRYVFHGEEKATIQADPTSPAAVGIVKRLLARSDLEHPGTFLERAYGVRASALEPAIALESYRFTFFVWLDEQDALRCSIDRFWVSDLRKPPERRAKRPVSEVEIAVYPRISPEIARDARVVDLIRALHHSLCDEFAVASTKHIKYQRGAKALGILENRIACTD